MSKQQRLLLKVAFYVALFIIGFIFHGAILGVAK